MHPFLAASFVASLNRDRVEAAEAHALRTPRRVRRWRLA
jgi:hypothetical protein